MVRPRPEAPGETQLTPKALTAIAIYYEDVTVLENVAKLLDRADDARRYAELAAEIRADFQAKFPELWDSQTGRAMPLVVGLVPPEKRQAVLDALVNDVQTKGLTAGDVGYRARAVPQQVGASGVHFRRRGSSRARPSPGRPRRRHREQHRHATPVRAVDHVEALDCHLWPRVVPLLQVGGGGAVGAVIGRCPGELGAGEGGGGLRVVVVEVDLGVDRDVRGLPVGIGDDVAQHLVLLVLPQFLLVATGVYPSGLQEEQRVGLLVDRNTFDLVGELVGHSVAGQHDDGGHGRGREVVDLERHTGEGLLAGGHVLEGELLLAKPAAVVAVLGRLLGDVQRGVLQVGASDEGLAAGEGRLEIAQDGRQEGALLDGVLGHFLVVLEEQIAQDNVPLALHVVQQPAHIEHLLDIPIELRRALRLEIDVVDAEVGRLVRDRRPAGDLHGHFVGGSRRLDLKGLRLRVGRNVEGQLIVLLPVEEQVDFGLRVVEDVADPGELSQRLRLLQGDRHVVRRVVLVLREVDDQRPAVRRDEPVGDVVVGEERRLAERRHFVVVNHVAEYV
ncbi:MAG: hypothetical protein GW892_23310 [Armatimonadetes bacterium]|nr:hypothetical protein [Armatimonadota bacterium]NCO92043.1 hypothetical protein [Armatimonadota bacterium]